MALGERPPSVFERHKLGIYLPLYNTAASTELSRRGACTKTLPSRLVHLAKLIATRSPDAQINERNARLQDSARCASRTRPLAN